MKLGYLKPGKYVLAVSGGVDSMTLLDVLSKNTELDLVVAHFNHGIRDDSSEDEKLVLEAARKYNLSVRLGHARLGPKASEADARQARYIFLHSVVRQEDAKALITAHHQDDMLETAILNLLMVTVTASTNIC